MPKTKKERVSRVLCHLKPDDRVFRLHAEGAYCQICGDVLKCATKNALEVHANTPKHRNNARRSLRQPQITESTELVPKSVIEFEEDLVKAFLAADIPLHKLGNSHIQSLFETHAGKKLPSIYKARSTYVPKLYNERVNKLSERLSGKKLWVSKQIVQLKLREVQWYC